VTKHWIVSNAVVQGLVFPVRICGVEQG